MDFIVIGALLILIPIGAALAYFFRALAVGNRGGSPLEESLVLSAAKYRPMERLLQEDEFRFLASQEGYSPEMGKRLRKQRRQIFRGYLRILRNDFASFSLALQTLVVHSAEDRGDLAAAVAKQRATFALALLAVEARLLLHAAGISGVRVDARGMVESLEMMQAQIRMLLTPPEVSMAGI